MNKFYPTTGFPALEGSELLNIQNKLLELIIEFDAICKKHNITYYLDGGNALGALRHKGFIPWDDDIDIMIKKIDYDNLEKVIEEYCKQNSNRVFTSCLSETYLDKQYARFIRSDIPMIMTSIMSQDYTPGIFIDIFILDGIETKLIKKYTKKLEKSEEWFHKYLNGITGSSNFYEYLLNIVLKKFKGEKFVSKLHMNLLDRFEEKSEKIEYYIPRNGHNYAIYDAEIFQEPLLLEYENVMLPVATKPEKHMRIHYSIDWFILPDNRFSHHPSVTSEHFPPAAFQQEFDWRKDQSKYRKTQITRKAFQLLRHKHYIKRQKLLASKHAIKLELELQKLLNTQAPLEKIYELDKNKDYKAIYLLLQPYYTSQQEIFNIYKTTKQALKLPDNYLYYCIKAAMMCDSIFTAHRLLSAQTAINKKEEELLSVLNNLLEVECHIQDKEFEQATIKIKLTPEKHTETPAVIVYRKKLGLLEFSTHTEEISYYEEAIKCSGQNYDLDKLIADCYLKFGENNKAMEIYHSILENHNNMLVIMEVTETLKKVRVTNND